MGEKSKKILKRAGKSVWFWGGEISAAWDGFKVFEAKYYNDLTLHGIWNNPGEGITVVGNHVARFVTETPATIQEASLQILGGLAIVSALVYLGREGYKIYKSENSRRTKPA